MGITAGAAACGQRDEGPVIAESTERAPVVDARAGIAHDEYAMGTAVQERERRSSRVFMRVRVVVAGRDHTRRRFREASETIVISAHGGLLYLNREVDLDALLVLTNPFTQEEQECRIVYLGDNSGKGRRVGLEFLTPAPQFWGVEFAQPDWTAPSRNPQSN
jgi:hypothetical protein